jgi:hypothetical protein
VDGTKQEKKNMIGVKPYIGFQGECEEALNFYKDAMKA